MIYWISRNNGPRCIGATLYFVSFIRLSINHVSHTVPVSQEKVLEIEKKKKKKI